MTSRVLDCDQVFDALTRGPFSGAERGDAGIEAHLEVCPECRQLAEALRPAVDLFHESLQDDDLPCYEGALPLADEESITALMTKVRRTAPATKPRPSNREHASGRIDPVAVIVAGVVGLILGVLVAAPGDRFETPSMAMHASAAPDDDGQALLDNLQLVGACREFELEQPNTDAPLADSGNPHASLNTVTYACCTECHSADHGGPELKERHSITKLLRGCQACHKAA